MDDTVCLRGTDGSLGHTGVSVGTQGICLGAVLPDVINRLLLEHVSPPGPFCLQVSLPLDTGD